MKSTPLQDSFPKILRKRKSYTETDRVPIAQTTWNEPISETIAQIRDSGRSSVDVIYPPVPKSEPIVLKHMKKLKFWFIACTTNKNVWRTHYSIDKVSPPLSYNEAVEAQALAGGIIKLDWTLCTSEINNRLNKLKTI